MNGLSIVERLRELAVEWHEMCGDIHEPLTEAADTIEELLAEGSFLLARIDDMDWSTDPDEFARQWNGHVEPPLYRVRAAISKAKASPISGATT